MGRFFGLVAVFLVVVTWSVAFGGTPRSPAAPFLMTGATDIEVVALGTYDWQISYQAPRSPTPGMPTSSSSLSRTTGIAQIARRTGR